jgi:nucleotide-binding universal stress UspA family protein
MLVASRTAGGYGSRGPRMIDSMLVATDGSETAAKAVSEAADLAVGTGARVHVMTAYQPLRARVASGRTVDPEVGDWHLAQDSRADSILDEACATLRLRGVEAEPHARKGDPADAIIELAEELGTELIVVGNKGLTGARRFLLGSVPDKVSHHAPCSVLIVYTT